MGAIGLYQMYPMALILCNKNVKCDFLSIMCYYRTISFWVLSLPSSFLSFKR